MKILICNDNFGAHFYIRQGLGQAFASLGCHEVIFWNIFGPKSVNDAFDEFEPDLFFCQTYSLKPSIIKSVLERPHLKVVLKASDWGSLGDTIDRSKYSILFANNKEIDIVLELYEKIPKSNMYLEIHYHSDFINITHNYWMKYIPVYSNLSACNIFEFTNGQFKPEYQCDLGFVGNYLPQKSDILNQWLYPLCNKYKVKIFGNSLHPTHAYCGVLPDSEVKHAFKSSTICINFHEKHSRDLGFDIIEKPYKIAGNKCFMISDYVKGLYKLYGNSMVYAKTLEEFNEKINYYLKNPDERLSYIEQAFQITIQYHTYFERAYDIFNRLGYQEEANNILETKKEVLKKLRIEI